jgi:energy-coupling factor transport system permease protein
MEIKKSISIGQYIPANSFLHLLDPRTKLISILGFIIMIFFIKDLAGYLLLLVLMTILIMLSTIPFSFFLRGLKPILFLIFFTVVIQLFMTKGTPLLVVGPLMISLEGVYAASYIFLRLVLLVFASSILTLTTSPIGLTNALEYLLRPFKVIGIPASEISMMMTIALRFIPTILEETDRLIKAQTARGVNFEKGNLFKRLQQLIPILVPLFVSAFRRADDLAIAMEARCFQVGKPRTHLKELRYTTRDWLFYVLFFAPVICIVWFF